MAEPIQARTLAPIMHKGKTVFPAGKVIKVQPSQDGKNYYVPLEGRGAIVVMASFLQVIK
jgi:hypothetical protein